MGKPAKFCTECGKPLLKDDKYCSYCGALVNAEPVEDTLAENTPEEEKTAKTPIKDTLPTIESTTHEDQTIKIDPVLDSSATPSPNSPDEGSSDSSLDSSSDSSLNNEKTQVFDAVPLSSSPYSAPSAQPVYSPTPTKEFPVVPGGAPQGQPVSNPQVYRADAPQTKQGLTKQQLGIIIGAAVVVVIALIIVIVLLVTGSSNTNQETTTQETQTTTQPSAPDQSAGQATAESSMPTSAADRDIYNRLSTFYDRLGTYDQNIADAATTFNNLYTATSMSERDAARDAAYDLRNDISAEMDNLQVLSVPSSSEYYANYNDISTCYYDCYMRISVICESWDISLRYSNPADHTDEITEPIARDNVDGTNRYLTEFDSLYESARPAAPRN